MEYPFSNKGKDTDHSALPRGRTEGMDSGSTDNRMQDSNFEDSLGNVAEQMNFDVYAGSCNSPGSLADQLFPSFASSPITSASTNFSPFDGLNFTHQYNSGISIVDGNIMGSSFVCGGSPLPFATDCADDGYDLNERNTKSLSQHNIAGDVRSCVIPRLPMQSLAEKMLRALNLFKEWSEGGILAQMWVPVQNGDRYILSTCEQPYLLDQTLSGYREVSRSFTFSAETKPGCFMGLPGRVFASKIPEWTSNVMYYNKTEYLRVQHAVDHEVRGSIALPVFEDDSLERPCCAVLELVTMKEKSNFDLEMENVCRALEVVSLRSGVPPRLYPQSLSRNQRTALAEITDVLHVVCYAHRLPLALTWISCSYVEIPGDKTIKVHARGCHNSLNAKCILCIENAACCVNDKNMEGFVHACVEHYLEEGKGIAGKALQVNHPCFYADVKEYHISEYPLVHHARKYGLNAAVAIRLRSIYSGDNDYILEMFLPVNMRGSIEQQLLLNNLSSTMQRICKSLRTVSDAELHGVKDFKVKLHDREMNKVPTTSLSSSEPSLLSGNLNGVDPINQNLFESTTTRVEVDVPLKQSMTGSRKQMEKKRPTTEKHVSLSVLQQYFSGSLKDAAKSIGVCPTTLKRICRQHGILRWPSRKINKVNRSLKKIKSVLDSVQVMEGGLKFDPTIEGLAAGSMIQELGPGNGVILPKKNEHQLLGNSDLLVHNANSAPTSSCMDIETTMVKMEKECLLYGNQVAGEYKPTLHEELGVASLDAGLSWPASPNNVPRTSKSHFISQDPSIVVDDNEINTKLKGDMEMDKGDGVVAHKPPVSSSMTDSSNGSESCSMMYGSSSSSRSFCIRQNYEIMTNYGDSGSKLTVKATYKEDTVRFKFEPTVGCVQLCEQIAKRFKLQMGQFQIKYLDDEEEWVMLLSDSDLQECLEILDFVGTRNVKLLVHDVPSAIGSSGASNCFLGEGR